MARINLEGSYGTLEVSFNGGAVSSDALDVNVNGEVVLNGVTVSVTGVSTDSTSSSPWTYQKSMPKPQLELRYEYAADGKVSKISAVDQTGTDWATYGPEKYVVEYKYDDVGRLVRKVVRDNPSEDNSTRYESDYTFDGMGRLIRERIWRYDWEKDRMIVTQDTQTKYDLGGNPTEIKFYDAYGWAYTETRTYARGYQITDTTFSQRTGVTATTSGSFTYDTNNNMLTSKGVDIKITSGNVQLAYRENWTFEFDRKNRMINFTHSGTNLVRHIWYDGKGRVWQRWT